jgi:hypothetical protein
VTRSREQKTNKNDMGVGETVAAYLISFKCLRGFDDCR